ncbi:MFS transporter [Phenylobacterium sp. J426]|uniref:spinster family MFS transporter n=1 Tax=Phenylobacterium sp. J426 TaxID=2898439 RepID=UPI002151C0F6|nr:MFS transporter [Phenylobacterium sp. J426]MCR5875017.1 MFS transporter [Phenylobacterium sp. J426]
MLAYTFNFIDRTIISTIGQAIKEDLKLTDAQLGWLGGLSFALLYTTLGIPIARLAERKSRVNIITIAIVVWSGFTALCGLATSYVQLLLFRVGVGIGEAGLSPPAHSLISDYFEPKKRASALSIYAFGIPLGTMFGAIAGGWIAQNVSWQAAFMLVGLPGIAVALLIKLVVKEPPRGWADRQLAIEAESAGALGREASIAGAPNPPLASSDPALDAERKPPSMAAVAKRLLGSWGLFHIVAGMTLASFAGYGAGQYVPPYLIRQYGLDLATAGLLFGLVAGVANGAGTLLGGFLTDWASKRSVRWYALVPAIGLMVATPLYLWTFTRDTWQAGVAFWMVGGVLHYTYLGPTFGVVQNAMDTRMRATAAALLLFIVNLIALGFGPPFTGWLIDLFAQNAWVTAGGAGALEAACPGGVGPAGAGGAVDAACRGATAVGTRLGLLGTTLIYAWAGLHYLLAALTLPRDIARAQAAQQN